MQSELSRKRNVSKRQGFFPNTDLQLEARTAAIFESWFIISSDWRDPPNTSASVLFQV